MYLTDKIKGYRITTHKVESAYFNGFLVDIVEKSDVTGDSPLENCWEAWLYHKDIGVKELMFGMLKEQALDYEFRAMVKDNLEVGTYLQNYIKEHIWEQDKEEE